MPRKRKTYVCVIELDDNTPLSGRYSRLNPGFEAGMPKVIIEFHKAPVRIAYVDGNLETSENNLVREHGVRVLEDFNSDHTSRWGVVSRFDTLARKMREARWAVYNNHPPSNRNVYVVLLDPRVRELTKVQKLNPNANPNMKCVYVGQTSLSPHARFSKHLQGYKSSSYVERFGQRLIQGLLRSPNPVTELEALREEHNLARLLRSKGYTVVGGH